MSHFAVLVIGDNWEKQLAPYQENNMENCPKEYLEFHDVEEEYRLKYENDSRKEFYCSSFSSYGQELKEKSFKILENCKIGDEVSIKTEKAFSYFEKGKYYQCYNSDINVSKYPDKHIWVLVTRIVKTNNFDKDLCFSGAIKVKIIDPPRDILFKEFYSQEFEYFIKEWTDYEKDENGKYGFWGNPNAKWDWYTMGGRWTGFFKIKDDCSYKIGTTGLRTEKAKKGFGDQAYKKDIDFAYKKNQEIVKAGEYYDKIHRIIKGRKIPIWEEILEKHNEDSVSDARDEYNNNLVIKDLRKEDHNFYDCRDLEALAISKREYTQKRKDSINTTFAVIKDGKWYSKGGMGWWGVVHDEQDQELWNKEFNKLVDNLSDNTLLTIVDCHI